jgi:hypothetical protein
MPLPLSGAIDFSDINVELGVAANTQRALGGATTRTLYNVPSGAIRLAADGYGKSVAAPTFPTWYNKYSNLANFQSQMSFVDNSGNVYQYLTSAASSVFGFGFIKFNNVGNVQFQRTVTTNGSSRYFTPGTKTAAANNSALWTVVNDDPLNTGTNFALNLIKYDLNGALLWNRRINFNATGRESQVRLAVDSSGNSWIATGNGTNLLIFKHDNNGTLTFQSQVAGIPTCNAVTCDGAGSFYVAGNVTTTNLIYVMKLNSAGALQWRGNFTATGFTVPSINAICTTSGNAVGLAGVYTSGVNQIGLMMTLNNTGTFNWARSTSSINNMYGVIADSSNNFYFTGTTSTGTQSSLIKYNSTGTLQFQRQLGGTGTLTRDISINSSSLYIYTTMFPSTSNVGLVSLPVDGTKAGTYATLSYSTSAYTFSNLTWTRNNASNNITTPAFTSQNNNPPPTITTSSFTITKTNIP